MTRDRSKLPQWAVQEFNLLEKRLDAATEKAAQLSAQLHGLGEGQTAVAVRSPYRNPVPVAWGQYDVIRFFLPNDEDGQEAYADVVVDESGMLSVRTTRSLKLLPQSANRVHISSGRP